MSRRMIDPQTIIKSQVADDKYQVDLNEILEKYGTVINDYKTITVQIYNKFATDEKQNSIFLKEIKMVNVVVNGSITITKADDGVVMIQGMLIDDSYVLKNYVEIQSGSYEDGIIMSSGDGFDLYVIRV